MLWSLVKKSPWGWVEGGGGELVLKGSGVHWGVRSSDVLEADGCGCATVDVLNATD